MNKQEGAGGKVLLHNRKQLMQKSRFEKPKFKSKTSGQKSAELT